MFQVLGRYCRYGNHVAGSKQIYRLLLQSFENWIRSSLPLPKIINNCCELVKLFHINYMGPVLWDTGYIYIYMSLMHSCLSAIFHAYIPIHSTIQSSVRGTIRIAVCLSICLSVSHASFHNTLASNLRFFLLNFDNKSVWGRLIHGSG